ncbi:MAG: dTDP-4-dehydrorhamnose 3,5-epimerase [Negativicutes bacterium]|nr:dTDP-4-dehydrorhamnose 3,5-epimerase [Negativicutes bacterium]
MKFTPTPIQGAFLIEPELKSDQRGFFARLFCEKEFGDQGLETRFVQMNEAFNVRRGTLRGMHYQAAPDEEVKLVRCMQGAVYDVVLDMRRDSATFGKSFGAELSAENRRMMYIPRGCAHGYITLTDAAGLFYLVSTFYAAQSERGLRFDDPAFKIDWPLAPVEMSDKDRAWPAFGSRA